MILRSLCVVRRSLVFALVACAAVPLGVVASGETVASARSASQRSEQRIERIVTLGDSYSSGVGIHRNASDYDDHGPAAHSFSPSSRLGHSACHREIDDTPGPRLARQLGADSVFVACAGAVIAEVPNQVGVAKIPADGAGTVIAITIGGNDLRTLRGETWPETLVRCITSSRCDRSSRNQVANFDVIGRHLTELYTGIGARYPAIAVRVLAYPRLMQSDRFCEGVTGVSRAEADWVDEQVDLLNAEIGSAVAAAQRSTGADIRLVPVLDEFRNRGACRFWQRDRFVNDSLLGETLQRSMTAAGDVRNHWNSGPLNFSSSSFHPSSKGYGAYFDALASSLHPRISEPSSR
jgi:lysophospholipase L1-like esterase